MFATALSDPGARTSGIGRAIATRPARLPARIVHEGFGGACAHRRASAARLGKTSVGTHSLR
ncbi:hypothetical protein L512_3449 [Bordetella bronchiseptica MBORD624]|uniref:Uncharacterized protein n=1 Tax=Bordetella bronchiseptica 00-P-2796 TaxID=1331199 RepID=A0ABR4R9U1_BORBO|nr:hypothetical protein L490_3221 [Bordetella bronchiseptica 00-P-2796]KDC68033.1 hypothetical protein L512_3449 [Bordetella bronchiseptica MBORD624]